MNSSTLTLVLTATLLLPAGCGDDAEAGRARKETREALDAINQYSRKEIQDMTTSLRNQWTDLKIEAAKLKAEAGVRGEAAQQSVQRVIEDIEQQAAAAQDKLADMAEAGSADASQSLDKLEESLQSAKSAVEAAWRQLKK